MNVKLRIDSIRLYNKCQENPDYAKKIGITVSIINNKEIAETDALAKEPDSP